MEQPMKINYKEIKNVFFKMPPPDWLGWRSEIDYIYEYVEYLRDRRGIIIPDHAVIITDADMAFMIKKCRIIFTTGDVDVFRLCYNRDQFSMSLDGVKFRELSAIREEYENEWGEF